MKYTLFQNDKALYDADNMKEAELMARSLIKQAKVLNKQKGLICLRPSQYVQTFKYMKEVNK